MNMVRSFSSVKRAHRSLLIASAQMRSDNQAAPESAPSAAGGKSGPLSRLRSHCSEVKDDGWGDADCGEVGVGATVVSGVDASPVLEPAEHVRDFMALSIEDGVVGIVAFPGPWASQAT
jgi:hypothetical protein